MLQIVVIGDPAPQGSMKHVGNGRMVPSSKRLLPWRTTVKNAAIEQLPGDHVAYDEAMNVYLEFRMRRPRTVTRDLPTVAPDLDKLVRAVFDSFTDAGVWKDDCLVTTVYAKKTYTSLQPGVTAYLETETEYEKRKLSNENN
jgi:Holliday junction resolvase RusA-like endonuclease